MHEKTKISIVVLAGRDRNNLKNLLNTLRLLSDLPHEVVIVFDVKNHGKPDPLLPIGNCKLIGVEFFGDKRQPQMRNIGLNSVSGDFVWFIDDDVSIDVDSIKSLKVVLDDIKDNPKVGVIAGRIIENVSFDVSRLPRPVYLSMTKGPVGYFNYDDFSFPKDKYGLVIGTSGKSYAIIPFVQGTSMVFRKDYLQYIKGFDEDLGVGYSSFEDSEPCFTMIKRGWMTIYSGDFELNHHKLLRIGGSGRGHENYEYASYFIRNYFVSLLKNRFPSFIWGLVYLLIFSAGHVLRVAYHNNGRHVHYSTIPILLKSFLCVLKGLVWGCKAIWQSKLKRINTGIRNDSFA